LPFDSIRVDLQSDSFSMELRALRLITPQGSLGATGRIAYLPSVRRWIQAEKGSRSPEALAKAAVQAQIEMSNLQLDRIFMARQLGSEEPDWAARFSADLALDGTVGEPRVTLEGRGEELVVDKAQADSLSFSLTYGDGRVDLRDLLAIAQARSDLFCG